MTLRNLRLMLSFADVPVADEWAFNGATRSDTTYISHGYHRYPAKFIPQLARRLIEEHSKPGATVVDPFCGCGTTLVESLVADRHSYGSDINPIAVLITKAKLEHIEPSALEDAYGEIVEASSCAEASPPANGRIDYWFKAEQKQDLANLLSAINGQTDEDIRRFYLCAFSNILKNCSIWNQKSNKPIRDWKKTPPDVMKVFGRQVRAMAKGNAALGEALNGSGYSAVAECRDSRDLPLPAESVDLVVTSPPYVTSYEYGDLHQLSMLWLEGLTDLREFRGAFIGSTHQRLAGLNGNALEMTRSQIASGIHDQLRQVHAKTAYSVTTYFSAMYEIWSEMYRVLRDKGRVCIVIGNTSLKGTRISNAEVFVEQMESIGFRLHDAIRREIPSKNLPSTRDKATGRFAKASESDALAYPTELVLVLEK